MGVRLENVSRYFGGLPAVNNVSIEIRDGEFFVLLGSSGSGKTTTLRMIAGLERPSAGTIYIHGRDVTALPPRQRDVAMVFQDYGLYPHLTVYENIRFPLRIRRVPNGEHKRRVEDVAARLKIEQLLGKKPGQCSGGEKQRVALARALVRNTRLFLMDEPLSNLDAKLRLAMRGELKQLASDLGITTVYVTHDQSEAMALASRVGVMSHGVLAQVARPLEIYDAPANLFVAGFIGSPPMNFISGRTSDRGDVVVDDADLRQVVNGGMPHVPPSLGGRRVVVGIRPEHLLIERGGTPAQGGRVDLIEPMGQDTLVHLSVGRTSLLVTTRSRDIERGEWVRVQAQPERIVIIDQKNDQTIFARGEVYRGGQV